MSRLSTNTSLRELNAKYFTNGYRLLPKMPNQGTFDKVSTFIDFVGQYGIVTMASIPCLENQTQNLLVGYGSLTKFLDQGVQQGTKFHWFYRTIWCFCDAWMHHLENQTQLFTNGYGSLTKTPDHGV
jgi:hypothetical protein